MYLELMNAGRALIAGSLNVASKPKITSFDVGAAAGFRPDRNAVGVLPSIAYTGNVSGIRKTIVSEDEIILSVVLPNSLTIPSVGNIMLRTSTGVPFVWFVLNTAFGKRTIDNEKHFAGDLQFQSMVIKIPQIANRLDLSVNSDFYANPARYSDLSTLPSPVLSPSSEAIIDNENYMYNSDRPIHAIRINNEWWGAPGMKPLGDESFGTMDGGVVGDGFGGY